METVSGGNASVISPDSESEVVIDTALNELETVSGNDAAIGSNEYTEVVQVDLSSLETELVGVNEKLPSLFLIWYYIDICIPVFFIMIIKTAFHK